MLIARSRFLCCERSFWQLTTIPVGMCVMRTAESVVFTCCPPLPPERYVSMRMSSGLMIDLDALVDFRGDEDAGERSMPSLRLIERRDAHQAMHTDLADQQAVGVFARSP